jgi:hypothetical protein
VPCQEKESKIYENIAAKYTHMKIFEHMVVYVIQTNNLARTRSYNVLIIPKIYIVYSSSLLVYILFVKL